ncbi:MAG: diguanylate cyclase [Polaromonas sp.]|nr:diguanylate cyclase [Polaromonas sp.]
MIIFDRLITAAAVHRIAGWRSAGPFLRWLTIMVCAALLHTAAHAVTQPPALAQAAATSGYWIDNTGTWTVEQVVSAELPWRALPADNAYALLPRQTLWIRFSLPPAPPVGCCVVEIPYPAVDRASLYAQQPGGTWSEQRAGDLTPVNRWSLPYRHPLFALEPPAQAGADFFLRLENVHGFSAPVYLTDQARVLRDDQRVSVFLGSYFGLSLLGFAIGLGAGFWLRDRVYLYYGICAAMVGLTQAAVTGVAGLHLWPNAPQWTDRSLGLFATWMLMSLLLLNSATVSLAQRSRILDRIVRLVVVAGTALSVALAVTDSALRLSLLLPYVVLVLLLVLLVNFWTWRRGDRFAGWLLLSAIPLAASMCLAVARYLEWVPLTFALAQVVLGSMALELPAVLAVLLLRSQHRRENTRRVRGLDRIDPETGLLNLPVFMERMERMWARSARLKHAGAVMLIDIVNSEQIQRDFGRKAADELPLRLAERLLATAREIDSAARLSGRRFGMLLEGPLQPQDAVMMAQRLVARCLMPHEGLHEQRVAKVRVVYALVPHANENPQGLLTRLQERLSSTSPDDKKAVFTLTDAASPAAAKGPLHRARESSAQAPERAA